MNYSKQIGGEFSSKKIIRGKNFLMNIEKVVGHCQADILWN